MHDYVSSTSKAKEAFQNRRADYRPEDAVVKEFKKCTKEYTVIVFTAEWCPDCIRNVPVLDMISEATGLEIRILGHIMMDAKSNTRK